MRPDPMVQLKEMVDSGGTVSLNAFVRPDSYEVTVFEGSGHEHFAGSTLTEAINRAWTATQRRGGAP